MNGRGLSGRGAAAAAAAACALMAICAMLAGCSASPGHGAAAPAGSVITARGAQRPPVTPATTRAAAAKPAGPAALPVAPAGDGARPQTRARPRTDNAAFRNLVADVWLSVTTGHAGYARPAFFPLAAYEQVKAIANPAGDWNGRLWHDYALDVSKARQLAGAGARLVTVEVPGQFAAWVPVGACYNKAGYWHLPGARVVYQGKDGKVRSFGIASLISWRGTWYVVHFGAVSRHAGRGYVDNPQDGPGTPGPPGGCLPVSLSQRRGDWALPAA